MFGILSKRNIRIAGEEKGHAFVEHLRDFNREMADDDAMNLQPLVRYVSGGKSSYQKIAEDPHEFKSIMRDLVPQIATKMENLKGGDARVEKAKLSKVTLNLIQSALELGIISSAYYKSWGAKIMSALSEKHSTHDVLKPLQDAETQEWEKDQQARSASAGWFFNA